MGKQQQAKLQQNRNMKNKAIIDAILALLTEYQAEVMQPKTKKKETDLKSLKYLINQSIRQYDVPKSHFHLSQRALKRWNELSLENILEKHYQDKVVCDKLEGTSKPYLLFVGAKRDGTLTEITAEGFNFRQMFHEDHVIPVALVFEKLVQMENTSAQEIEKLLNKMRICVMLKEENHLIGRTKGRTFDYRKTFDEVYAPAGIKVVFEATGG